MAIASVFLIHRLRLRRTCPTYIALSRTASNRVQHHAVTSRTAFVYFVPTWAAQETVGRGVVCIAAFAASAMAGTRRHSRVALKRLGLHSTDSTTSVRVSDMLSPARKSALLLIVVAALFGSLGICVRAIYALPGAPSPAVLSLVRQALTVIVFIPIMLQGRERSNESSSMRNVSVHSLPKEFWPAALELAVWNFGTQALMNAGLALTSATRASFFAQMSVVITPLLTWMTGEAVPASVWGACGMALVGMLMLGRDGAADSTSLFAAVFSGFSIGDLMCLGGAATWSAYIFRLGVLSRRKLPSVPLQAAKTFLLCLAYVVWVGIDCLARRCSLVELWPGWTSPLVWAILLFSAIGPGALGDIWMQRASDNTSAATTNVLLSTEPLFAALFAGLLLSERLGSYGLIGAGCIFLAALVAALAERDGDKERSQVVVS